MKKVALMTLLCLTIGTGARADTTPTTTAPVPDSIVRAFNSAPLKGLKTIGVVVYWKPIFEVAGVKHDDIQVRVEEKMREVGLTITDKRFDPKGNMIPYLSVEITPVSVPGDDIVVYSLSCHLNEDVLMLRNVVDTITDVWSDDTVGWCGTSRMRDVVDHLDDSLTKFDNDYLTANPKS